jgi:hypothetical protein
MPNEQIALVELLDLPARSRQDARVVDLVPELAMPIARAVGVVCEKKGACATALGERDPGQ